MDGLFRYLHHGIQLLQAVVAGAVVLLLVGAYSSRYLPRRHFLFALAMLLLILLLVGGAFWLFVE